MKAVAWVVLLIGMFAGIAAAMGDAEVEILPDGSARYTLTPEQAAACAAGGGCVTVPLVVLQEAVQQIIQQECGKVGI